MDVDETLKQIRALLKIRRLTADQSAFLQDLMESLDNWIVGGGFLPASWAGQQTRHRPMYCRNGLTRKEINETKPVGGR